MSNGFIENDNMFADFFGLSTEKKEKKETNKKSSGNKKKSSSTKSSSAKKYKLPITVYTEYGTEVVGGDGELTLADVGKRLMISSTVEEKDGIFVAYPPVVTKCTDEHFEGEAFLCGDVSKEDIDIAEYEKNILEAYPELAGAQISKIGSYLTMRHVKENAIPWNFKVKAGAKIGFVNREHEYLVIENELTLKEAATLFVEQNEWLKGVNLWYATAETESEQFIIAYLSKDAVESTNLYIPLPCSVRFIHDEGPLKDGLTPEMFNGKTSIGKTELLKKIHEYFPDVYQDGNTSVNYVPTINTVCVMHIGRKKGALDIETPIFEVVKDRVAFKKKIPFKLLDEIIVRFMDSVPEEDIALIVFNKCSRDFRLLFPTMQTTTVSVTWDDMEVLTQLGKDEVIIAEIHSHNTMPAFFSNVDDADEKCPMLYGVIGKLDQEPPMTKFRVGMSGSFITVGIEDAFEFSSNIVSHSDCDKEFLILQRDGNDALLYDLNVREFVVAQGVIMDTYGGISWTKGVYLGIGRDFFDIDWLAVKEAYFSGNYSNGVKIVEMLTRTVESSYGETVDKYSSGEIVLDASDHVATYYLSN